MWDVAIEPRATVARCYECGSAPVSALCHHCWRPGCKKHVRPSSALARKMLGREGTGPGLGKASAYYCGDCAYGRATTSGATGRWLAVGLGGVALAMVGVVTVWLNLIVGGTFLVAGGLSGVGAYLRVRRVVSRRRAELPVRLLPKAVDVELTEVLRGQITLTGPDANLNGSDDNYRTVLEPVRGTLSMLLTFGGPDRDRVQRRRKRSGRPDAVVPWCAGRILLPGPFGIRPGAEIADAILPLDGDSDDHAVFRSLDPPSSSTWRYRRRYKLRVEPEIASGPIWITPSIVPDSGRHGLELDVQWVEFGPDEDKPLSLRIIELLRLEFPVSWGEIRTWAVRGDVSAQPRATLGLGTGRRFIELKRLTPAGQRKNKVRANHLTLSIYFSEQVKREDEISGRVTAEMSGTLSGVTGVTLFDSLGGRRALGKSATVKTRVDLGFRISLAKIRYQALHVAPDRAAEDSNRDSYADPFPLVPDDEVVIALTNAMSEERYYVKHVIEHPPRSGRRANELQRYWDIRGRRYTGVYPVEFHIILTGEEVHGGGIRPDRGTTQVRIVVKGAYTDDDMEQKVRDEYKRLRDLTVETLGRLNSTTSETD
ncbi:MAG TPA: hypothetical protein VHZ96_17575 [Frankiaceae bacterium]|nr:hypothetical protein [Frankiaceae bacterium]